MNTTTRKARALWIAIHLICASVTSGSVAQAPLPRQPASDNTFVSEQRPLAPASVDAGEDGMSEDQAEEATTLRRLRGNEMSVALARKAAQIIKEHHKKPFGTNIPFELNGKSYVGRIEQHYHEPGGDLRPWGFHPGCSLFAVETAH